MNTQLKLSEIKQEIQNLLDSDKEMLTKAQISKIKNRLQFLRTCEAYLKTDPDEKFLKKERERLMDMIEKISIGFKSYNVPAKFKGSSIRKYYEKECGVPLLKLQVNTIKFLSSAK